MYEFLKALVTLLTSSTSLTSLVSADNILPTYPKVSASLPSVVFGVTTNGSNSMRGVTSGNLTIEVRSSGTKKSAWLIYLVVKNILNFQHESLSTANCLVHLIEESGVSDNEYDVVSNAWVIRATYDVVFSSSDVLVFSASSGSIYADDALVSVNDSYKIGEFSGSVVVSIQSGYIVNNGLYVVEDDVSFNSIKATIDISNVQFLFDSMNKFWETSKNTSDLFSDGLTSATSYTFGNSSYPKELQFLLHGTKSDDSKGFEIFAPKAIIPSINVPFHKKNISMINCQFVLLSDSNGRCVKVLVEN